MERCKLIKVSDKVCLFECHDIVYGVRPENIKGDIEINKEYEVEAHNFDYLVARRVGA